MQSNWSWMLAILALAAVALGGPAVAQQAAGATNMFGGPVYNGRPALQVTAALVQAGGGAAHFSFSKSLVSMLGQNTVNAEVAKLTRQFGQRNVQDFIQGMNYAVDDSLKRATEEGIHLPPAPADLKGVRLAKTLVAAGTAPDDVWWAGWLFDKALTHKIHDQVMADFNAKFGAIPDQNTHRILNQAMYDVAQALGHKSVQLASLH
ncbi:MAG: hypothetical protein ACRD1Y_05480 [Terriglobales bacterium]